MHVCVVRRLATGSFLPSARKNVLLDGFAVYGLGLEGSGELLPRFFAIRLTTDDKGMKWLVNGKTHTMDEFPIVVQRGAKEIWEIHNDEKSMPHPMHIHGFQFRVVERVGTPEQVAHLVVDELAQTSSFKARVR